MMSMSTTSIGSCPASTPFTVIFCGGYRSSMNGRKALALQEHCTKNGFKFCSFDYRGHGGALAAGSNSNSDDLPFLDCTLSDWIHDTLDVLDRTLLFQVTDEQEKQQQKVILVGSSMGAWIAIHVAADLRPERVAGLVLIASAPDFTEDVVEGLTPEQKVSLDMDDGVVYLPSGYGEPYPFTNKLIMDARENWLLLDAEKGKKVIPFVGPVRLFHGLRDTDIPWQKSLELMEKLGSEDVRLTLIKDGDHRLSEPHHLASILAALDDVVLACASGRATS